MGNRYGQQRPRDADGVNASEMDNGDALVRQVINRDDYKQMIGQVIVSGKLARNDVRCIYENDDIMVEHAMVSFPNSSTDAVLVAMTLKDGKVFRTETGSTPLTK